MARKANDLLDIFRYQPEGADEADGGAREKKRQRRDPNKGRSAGGGTRTGSAGSGRGSKKAARAKRVARRPGGDGYRLDLTQRHVVLGGSVLALLLVLSFTLGLAAGRGKDGGSEEVSLQRSAARGHSFYVSGTIPNILPSTGQRVRGKRIQQELMEDFLLERSRFKIFSGKNEWRITVGPFASDADARRFVAHQGMEKWYVAAYAPFRAYEILRVPNK